MKTTALRRALPIPSLAKPKGSQGYLGLHLDYGGFLRNLRSGHKGASPGDVHRGSHSQAKITCDDGLSATGGGGAEQIVSGGAKGRQPAHGNGPSGGLTEGHIQNTANSLGYC